MLRNSGSFFHYCYLYESSCSINAVYSVTDHEAEGCYGRLGASTVISIDSLFNWELPIKYVSSVAVTHSWWLRELGLLLLEMVLYSSEHMNPMWQNRLEGQRAFLSSRHCQWSISIPISFRVFFFFKWKKVKFPPVPQEGGDGRRKKQRNCRTGRVDVTWSELMN